MLTLYHYVNSLCSQKVRMCLAEKGLDWQSRHVHLGKFEQWQPAYTRINPKGFVPALDHDGRILIESNVIIEYLEDSFPDTRLRPKDAYARALMRRWTYDSEEIGHANANALSHNRFHAPGWAQRFTPQQLQDFLTTCPYPMLAARYGRRLAHGVSAAEEETAYAAFGFLFDQMEAALANGPWLAGDDYSLGDIAVTPSVKRAEVLRPSVLDPARRPLMADWWRRIQARPAYKLAFSFPDPDQAGR
jgi:glutathione S-transferase